MMNKKEALEFLKKHQPMPNDKNLSKDVIAEYNAVREYFVSNPDKACIPLFLNSFGERDGFGVYQLVGELIAKFEKNIVMPYLLKCLESPNRSIRYWNAQISSLFPSEELLNPLTKLISENDVDIRYASITSIAQLALNGIKQNEVVSVLKDAVFNETESDILEFLKEVIDDIISSI